MSHANSPASLLAPLPPRWRRRVLTLAWGAVAIGAVWSVARNPGLLTGLHLPPVLAVAVVGVPLTIILNAAAFAVSAILSDRRVDPGSAVEVAVLGAVANLLPVPGAAVVRALALHRTGLGMTASIGITVIVAGSQIAVGFAYAGVAAFALGRLWTGGTLAAAAMVGFALLTPKLWRTGGRRAGMVLGLSLAQVTVDAIRVLWCLQALGVGAAFVQSAVLTASGALSALLTVAPGGLGVREFSAGALGIAAGIAPTQAFMAALLNRLVGLMVVLPAFLWVHRRARRIVD